MPDTHCESTQDARRESVQDARRAMEICNACRYCEGFCAVFPAMELHRAFADADLNHLANLCHGCRNCYYACQYAPPHEFGINVPASFAELRQESYARYAWPKPLATAFRHHGAITAISLSLGLVLVLCLTWLLQTSTNFLSAQPITPGAGFYRIIPKTIMTAIAAASFLFALLALVMSFRNFWRDAGRAPITRAALLQACKDAATLRYLGGAGHGCNDRDGTFSTTRRHLHHFMAYGFLLCFAATATGAVEDLLLNQPAPYPIISLPVLLGLAGGISMVLGCTGLLWLKTVADQTPQSRETAGADSGLLLLLLLIALTGLLLALRATAALGIILCIHLGLVLGFFLTAPYGKFTHGTYRFAALLRNAIEKPGA